MRAYKILILSSLVRPSLRRNQRKSLFGSVFRGLGYAARGVVFIVSIYLLVTLQSGTILAVQTTSMVPVFRPGDAIIVHHQNGRFKVGDIVSYRSRKDPRQIVSHRIIAIKASLQQLVTQGDHLAEPDPPIRNWDVLGKVVCIIPRAGYVLSFLYSWPGLICLVYIPALLMVLLEVRKLCVFTPVYRHQNNSWRDGFLTAKATNRYILKL